MTTEDMLDMDMDGTNAATTKTFMDFDVTAQETNPDDSFPLQMAAAVDLLGILRRSAASISLYKQTQEWFKTHYMQPLPSRAQVMRYLAHRYNCTNLWPKKTTCFLRGSQKHIPIVVHDVSASLNSLLSDPVLMQQKNLTIDLQNPHSYPTHDAQSYDEVCSGYVFRMGYQHYCEGEQTAVPCFLICFLDESNIDFHGHLSLHPLSYTLSIFKADIRKQPQAWRALGYLPNKASKLAANELSSGCDGLNHVPQRHAEANVKGKCCRVTEYEQ
jgi:hypothetical protein